MTVKCIISNAGATAQRLRLSEGAREVDAGPFAFPNLDLSQVMRIDLIANPQLGGMVE